MRERRKFNRLLSQEKANVQKEGVSEEGRLIDISPAGMRILLNNNIEVGNSVSGSFKIMPQLGNFYVQGKVIWVQPQNSSQSKSFDAGIQFSKVSALPLSNNHR